MLKTYLKIFLLTAPLFFLGELVASMGLVPARQALVTAVSAGLLFGVFLSAVLGTVQIAKARKAAAGETGRDIYSVRQTREFESKMEYKRLFEAVIHYLKKTRGYDITDFDEYSGRAAARTPFNWTTFGSLLSVKLTQREGAPTLVSVTAAPLLPTSFLDYGENLKLAREFEAHFKALS